MLKKEECVLSTEQRRNYAVVMGAHNMLRREECAPSMVLMSSTNDAAVKDVQSMLRKEECAPSMGQRSSANDAAAKDVQIML